MSQKPAKIRLFENYLGQKIISRFIIMKCVYDKSFNF